MTAICRVVSIVMLSVAGMVSPSWAAVCDLSSAGGSTCTHVGATWTCTDLGDELSNGDALQNAIDNAACGDTIVLSAGVRYGTRIAFLSGSSEPIGNPFILTNHSCGSTPITIKSSALSSMPAGQRVGSAQASFMPTIVANNNDAAFSVGVYSASYGTGPWVFQGLEFTNSTCIWPTHNGNNPVLVAVNSTTNASPIVHDITLDRVWIHPYDDTTDTSRVVRTAASGLSFNVSTGVVKDSSITGFCCFQASVCGNPTGPCGAGDLQASVGIGIGTGPGPVTLTNNLIEAYAWNIFTGGAGGDDATSIMVNPANTATVTSATATQATFSQVATLQVGDYIAIVIPGGWTTLVNCGGLTGGGGNGSFGAVAIVDTIDTGTKVVTYHGVGCDSVSDYVTGPPSHSIADGSRVQWRGTQLDTMTVTRNLFSTRTAWCDGTYPAGKSVWEIKQGSHITFTGNQIIIPATDPNNPASLTGCKLMNTAFAANERGNVPWVTSGFNTFTSNLFRGIGRLVSYGGYANHSIVPQPGPITFTNNLFDGTARADFSDMFGGRPTNATTTNTTGWAFTHNTVRGMTSYVFSATPDAPIQMTVRDNIFTTGTNGFTNGNPASTSYPSLTEDHNVYIKSGGIGDPPWNGFTPAGTSFVVANDAAVGFTDVTGADAGGDYHGYQLTGGTSCTAGNWRNCASDGTDPGVNFAALDSELGFIVGALSGGASMSGGAKVQ